MTICTYLHNDEYTAPTSNKTLNETLAEVRALTGEDWRVAERTRCTRRFLRRPIETKVYELYVGVGGPPNIDFQIINFYRAHDWSINTLNSAEHVIAYLYGVIAGMHQHRKGESDGKVLALRRRSPT
jgi:hypothetical protein